MSRVRVLVGTRKGAFVLEADGQRKKWTVSGPHFGGWEIYHVKGSALFRSTDGGQNWKELSGLRGHGTGPQWQPGGGGLCLHTIIQDPTDPKRIFVAISSAGVFRTDDGGTTWKPINRGLRSQYIPDPDAET